MDYESLLGIFLHLKCHPEQIQSCGFTEDKQMIDYEVEKDKVASIEVACNGSCIRLLLPNWSYVDVEATPEEVREAKYYIELLTEKSNEYWMNKMLCNLSL